MISKSKNSKFIHFVGVGGIGMSGIAEVFANQGYPVSGSDLTESDSTRRLASMGVKLFYGHQAENIGEVSVVVVSSAIKPSNPEVVEARKRRIPVIPRAEMLGELMRGKIGIAVAGTHGKTTTTSMLASTLFDAGVDPTIVIGGKVDALGGNAKLGKGSIVVAEADESDASFLHLPATYAVITNIDNDHMDHYGSLTAIEDAFVEFISKLPFFGKAAVCIDDPGVQRVLGRFSKPITTYGFQATAEWKPKNIMVNQMQTTFEVFYKDNHFGNFEINVPGNHNVLNALSSIAISHEIGLETHQIEKGLKSFKGVKRRCEIRWESKETNQIIMDDYGHHPTEIVATLSAVKKFWKGRIITVFQPHRYSRTLNCYDGFLSSFVDTDVLLLSDIYSAGEDSIDGISSEKLAKDIARVQGVSKPVMYVGSLETAAQEVSKVFTKGDLVLTLGAGTITKLPEIILSEIK